MTSKQGLSAALVTGAALAILLAAGAAGVGASEEARSSASKMPAQPFPEGVYRFKRTRGDILRVWPNAGATMLQALAGTLTFTFDDGAFSAVLAGGGTPSCRRGAGRYSAKGGIVTAQWTNFYGCPIFTAPSVPVRLRWAYDGEQLRFRLNGSGAPSVRVTWESNPFVRIGGRP